MKALKEHINESFIKRGLENLKSFFMSSDPTADWKSVKIRPLIFTHMKRTYNFKEINGAKILFDTTNEDLPEIWISKELQDEYGQMIDSLFMIAKYEKQTGRLYFHNTFVNYIDEPLIKMVMDNEK